MCAEITPVLLRKIVTTAPEIADRAGEMSAGMMPVRALKIAKHAALIAATAGETSHRRSTAAIMSALRRKAAKAAPRIVDRVCPPSAAMGRATVRNPAPPARWIAGNATTSCGAATVSALRAKRAPPARAIAEHARGTDAGIRAVPAPNPAPRVPQTAVSACTRSSAAMLFADDSKHAQTAPEIAAPATISSSKTRLLSSFARISSAAGMAHARSPTERWKRTAPRIAGSSPPRAAATSCAVMRKKIVQTALRIAVFARRKIHRASRGSGSVSRGTSSAKNRTIHSRTARRSNTARSARRENNSKGTVTSARVRRRCTSSKMRSA